MNKERKLTESEIKAIEGVISKNSRAEVTLDSNNVVNVSEVKRKRVTIEHSKSCSKR